jgi:Transposase DDE domain
LRSRFAAVGVRPAHRDYKRSEPYAEEWLRIEWPRKESEPTKYWLSTLPEKTSLKSLVKMAQHRWIIERDYEELKQELGLGHYEGRGWRAFHHHATLCIASYGFLVAERNRFSPSAHVGHIGLSTPQPPPNFRPRGSPDQRRRSMVSLVQDKSLLTSALVANAPNGITRVPSPHGERRLLGSCLRNSLTAPFVDHAPDNLRHPCRPQSHTRQDVNGWARYAKRRPAVSPA